MDLKNQIGILPRGLEKKLTRQNSSILLDLSAADDEKLLITAHQ